MNYRGFTLIETLVYLGLFAILMGGILTSAYGLFQSSAHNETRALVEEEGEYLIAKIDYLFLNVASIDTPAAGPTGGESTQVTLPNGVVERITLGGGIMASTSGSAFNNTNVMVADVPSIPFAVHSAASSDGITPEGVTASFRLYATSSDGFPVYQDFSSVRFLRK